MKAALLFSIVSTLIVFQHRTAFTQGLRTPIISQSANSPYTISSKEFEELRIETKILKERIDVLNSTNDKILNNIYWTIGSILTALFGLTVWNAIKNRNLDEEKFKIVLENSKKELSDSLNDKLKEAIKNASFSDLSSVKSDIRSLKYEAEKFKLYYMIGELKYHPFWNIRDDSYILDDYFNFIRSSKMTSEYKYLLETIINYLKSDPYMSLDDRNKIINFIDLECSDEEYRFYVDQIKKSIETLS